MHIFQEQSGIHFFMDSLKSDKVAMIFISQGREFQITESSVFYWIFSKIFSIDFWYTEIRNWLELLFTTNMLSKTWDARPCWIMEISRSSRPEVFWKYGANYRRTPMPKCDFSKVAYSNHTSAWVFSCKFAAYFQNTFS